MGGGTGARGEGHCTSPQPKTLGEHRGHRCPLTLGEHRGIDALWKNYLHPPPLPSIICPELCIYNF